MNIASQIIHKCGGPEIVSQWTDVDISTVYKWTYPKERGGTGGIIPSCHQPVILKKAQEEGKGVTPADFFPKPTEPKPTESP